MSDHQRFFLAGLITTVIVIISAVIFLLRNSGFDNELKLVGGVVVALLAVGALFLLVLLAITPDPGRD